MDEKNRGGEKGRDVRQILGFTVGVEEYGLDLLRVKEVIRMRPVTWLPKAPSCVKGIINLRGTVIPVIDLRDRFGLESQDHTAMTRVIVAEVEGQPVGMVVDSASQVVRVPSDQFDPPPSVMGADSRAFITSVGKLDDRLVIMVDVDRILSSEEINEIAGSLKAAETGPAPSGA